MKIAQSLTSKIYLIEFLSGSIFYVIGILLLTPASNPLFFKYVVLGSLMTPTIIIIVYTAIVKSENMDERATANYNKASSIALYTVFLQLLILGIFVKVFSINFNFFAGLIALTLASILCLHALSFYILEKNN